MTASPESAEAGTEVDEAQVDEAASGTDNRPARPAAIELAAAILIVSGVLGLIGTVGATPDLPAGSGPIVILTAALNAGSLVIGVLVRAGHAWLLAVNYVAVLGFLDLTGAPTSGLALILGITDVIVVIILLLHKPWFDAMRRMRERRKRDRRVPSPPVGGGQRPRGAGNARIGRPDEPQNRPSSRASEAKAPDDERERAH